MRVNTDRIYDAVPAPLLLGSHDRDRAWKTFDWDAMNRLHAKGLIFDAVSKAKSVAFTEEGLHNAQTLLQSLFGTAP